MNDYSITLFLHIVGALGLFAALGLEWTGLGQIQRATTVERAGEWMGILRSVRKVGFASMATTVITGIYLTVTAWGDAAWIIATLGALVLVIVLAQALTSPRMAAIGQALVKEKGPLSKTFQGLANHPLLSISIQTRAALALGIVFLKIAKPDAIGSLLTIGAAIVLGIASSAYLPRLKRAPAASTD